MARLSLPREAPRVLVQKQMPSKNFFHTFNPNPGTSNGVRLDPNYYTDTIHSGFFVQKTWSIEAMIRPYFGDENNYCFIEDLAFRNTRYGTQKGLAIRTGGAASLTFRFQDAASTQTWGVGGALSITETLNTWTHFAMAYIYDPANPSQSRFKVYINGYKHIDAAGYLSPLNNGNPFRSMYKYGPLDIAASASGASYYRYFRILNNDPWPDGGFEIPSATEAFTGTGQWLAGVNDPQPYPTVDPSNEIMKFNFTNKMTINDIVDESQYHWPIDYTTMTQHKIRFVP